MVDRRALTWLNFSWYAAKSPWRDLAASRWCKAARGSESSGGQPVVALRLSLLYCSGAEADHHKSYVTDLDIQTIKRAEGFLNATENKKGPWISDDPTEDQLKEMHEMLKA